jgi:hypothetical protein
MADFGKAGKLTIRHDDVAAQIDITAGEFLFYRLTAKGAEPIFTFGCKHRVRFSEHQFAGHPKATYEWTWNRPLPGSSIPNESNDAPDDMYGVAMSFIATIQYTLLVEHRDRNNNLIRVVKDVDYESQDPTDNFTESLRLFTI